MAELTQQDIIQQFKECVILYKGKPHKVKQIGKEITLLDLRTQRKKSVEFSIKEFCPPILRLGFVNLDGAAAYVSRKPVRIYFSGINSQNCSVTLTDSPCENDRSVIKRQVQTMEIPEFADMMLGHYPPLKSAFEQACHIKGAVAFDKQFAVDYGEQVFYKDKLVGRYMDEKIHWNEGCGYLNTLLDGNYEKAVRSFGKTT